MYIKSVRLKGFRTYKEASLFSFAPGYNAIVGLNGSGKSNVFIAISFVLGEHFPHMTKTNFLYKGDQASMASDYTAFVEVVFDISGDQSVSACLDNAKELSLKRTFSESRDVYTVNGKPMRPKEYRQFLESIHLIHSEQSLTSDLHYVVMQGSVARMSTLSAEDRLGVFREVAGHRSFDCKIEDCLKILQESTLTYNALDTQFQQVSRKLASLESQQREVQNWKDLDTRRKVLQCNLTLLKLRELEENLKKAAEEEGVQSALVADLQKRLEALESQLSQHRSYLSSVAENAYDQKSHELNNLHAKFDEIANEINVLVNEVAVISYNKENDGAELQELNTSMKTTAEALEELIPKLGNLSEQISKTEMEINDLLYKKGARSSASEGSKKGSDVARIIDKLEKQKAFLTQTIKDHQSNRKRVSESLLKVEEDLKRARTDLGNVGREKARKLKEFEKHTMFMEKCSEVKRVKQKHLSTEMLKLSKLKGNLLQAQENFKKVSYSNQQVLDLIRLWFTETSENEGSTEDKYGPVNHKNFVGLLIDVITVKDEYKIAIEQVLGPKLFTIVVSDIGYAKALVKFIEDKRSKYATNIRIVSLDLLNEGPETASKVAPESDALPLKSCIKYDKKLDALVNSLLRDFNLVPDATTALKLLKTNQNSVTPNGEIFYHNGIVSGGYVNLADSTLLLYKKLKNVQDEFAETEANIKKLNAELDEINKKQEEARATYNASKEEYNTVFEQHNSMSMLIANVSNIEDSLKQQLQEDKEHELSNQLKLIDQQIKNFKDSAALRRDSRKGEKQANADDYIDAKLEVHYGNLTYLNNQKSSLDDTRQQLEAKYRDLSARKNELSKKILADTQMLSDYDRHLRDLRRTLKEVETAKDNLDQELSALYLNESLQNKIDDANLEILKLENETKSESFRLQQESAKLKSLTQLKSSITLAINEYTAQLNCVDVKTREAAQSGLITERSLVLDKLAKINKECSYLDYSSHISLKDCNDLQNEFEELHQRKKRIAASKEEIYKSIKKLKSEKDKNLVDLVQKTSLNAAQIFQQLVPSGRMKLVLIKNDKGKNLDTHLPECFVPDKDENFTGLDIKVSFTPGPEDSPINQLSGGQKTLVSLAFILSLQKLKPTPFYLLDEVDSALDDQYRTKLAKLLDKQSQSGSQIIVTTFREQLLKPAQMFYEITNENGVSNSKEVTLSRAMEVVKQVPKHALNVTQEPLPLTN